MCDNEAFPFPLTSPEDDLTKKQTNTEGVQDEVFWFLLEYRTVFTSKLNNANLAESLTA